MGVDFGEAFGGAHHVGGVHSLVGRHHHELIHAIFHCEVGDDFRAVHVVDDGFGGVDFHHGHVLVGRGVNHEGGAVKVKCLLHASLVLHATDKADDGYFGE